MYAQSHPHFINPPSTPQSSYEHHEPHVQISEPQVLQSHTVLKSLTVDAKPGESRADEHVLVVGGVGDEVRMVAERYEALNLD